MAKRRKPITTYRQRDEIKKVTSKIGSIDNIILKKAQKLKKLYENISQMTDNERQKRISDIKKGLGEEKGANKDKAYDRLVEMAELENSLRGEGKTEEEINKILLEKLPKGDKSTKKSAEFNKELKELELFPKVKEKLEYIDRYKKTKEKAKAEGIEKIEKDKIKLQEKEKEAEEKIKEIEEEIKKIKQALQMIGDSVPAAVDPIKAKIEELRQEKAIINLDKMKEQMKALDKKLECVKLGESELDKIVARCNNPWEEVLANMRWEDIANISLEDLEERIKFGSREKDPNEISGDNTTQGNQYNGIFGGDQADNLRRKVEEQRQEEGKGQGADLGETGKGEEGDEEEKIADDIEPCKKKSGLISRATEAIKNFGNKRKKPGFIKRIFIIMNQKPIHDCLEVNGGKGKGTKSQDVIDSFESTIKGFERAINAKIEIQKPAILSKEEKIARIAKTEEAQAIKREREKAAKIKVDKIPYETQPTDYFADINNPTPEEIAAIWEAEEKANVEKMEQSRQEKFRRSYHTNVDVSQPVSQNLDESATQVRDKADTGGKEPAA